MGFAPLHFSRQQHVHPIAASNTTAEQQAALTWRTPPTATYIKRTLLIMVLYLCCQCCCWHCHWSYSISTCPPTRQRLPVDSQSTLPHRGRQCEHILHSDKNAPQNIFLVFFFFLSLWPKSLVSWFITSWILYSFMLSHLSAAPLRLPGRKGLIRYRKIKTSIN